MSEYLLAAEADKIQDLIFRSSHLREVVGGSQMLSRFCNETATVLIEKHEGSPIVTDGGSFRVVFPNREKTIAFGDVLAEKYRQTLGGTLTVAEPVPINGNFQQANDAAHSNLRSAKQHQVRYVATEHIPYTAYCVSCGVGLAEKHEKLHKNDAREQYFCAQCLSKSQEWSDHRLGSFLSPFYKLLEREISPDAIPVPEDVARLDPRGYVAYMVADGNDMGRIFGKCSTSEQLISLSKDIPAATWGSLAVPTRLLVERPDVPDDNIPVLPLILGGDDLFALLPAPWSLDFAYRFALAYEEEMQAVVKDFQGIPKPTISIAIIICKAKYPYYLAHQRGDELLSQAKQFTKRCYIDSKRKNSDVQPRSVITFDVILGSRLAGAESNDDSHRSTLRPFWVEDDVPEWGISIKHLIEQRYILRSLSRKRLIQLRSHFDDLWQVKNAQERKKWVDRLEKILNRTLQVSGDEKGKIISQALETLGGKDLFAVKRSTDKNIWHGHALPDLLSTWDFTFNLNRDRSGYEE